MSAHTAEKDRPRATSDQTHGHTSRVGGVLQHAQKDAPHTSEGKNWSSVSKGSHNGSNGASGVDSVTEEPNSGRSRCGRVGDDRTSNGGSRMSVEKGVGSSPPLQQPPAQGHGHQRPLGETSSAAGASAYGLNPDPYSAFAAHYAQQMSHFLAHPLPLSTHTNEGRYHWPTVPQPFHYSPMPAAGTSHPDMPMLNVGAAGAGGLSYGASSGDSLSHHIASRLQWDQCQRQYQQQGMSPAAAAAAAAAAAYHMGFLGPFGQSLADYMRSASTGMPPPASVASQRGSAAADMLPVPGTVSVTLPPSLSGSRLTSPRPSLGSSVGGGKSRKRVLSQSPLLSDYLDIQSLTRSSEGSLQFTPYMHTSSRSSSAASGSYGHLSAASFAVMNSPVAALRTPGGGSIAGVQQTAFLQAAAAAAAAAATLHPALLQQQQVAAAAAASSRLVKHEPARHGYSAASRRGDGEQSPRHGSKEHGCDSVVSSTVRNEEDAHLTELSDVSACIKRELASGKGLLLADSNSEAGDQMGYDGEVGDFIETVCHWKDCGAQEFKTQDDLVRHINLDHIAANRRQFVCRWSDCQRQERPFKAQYMLVVHMRRHTGEKPHRCTFEGCHKAYSRLENLKTHLRSHTGEKPYTCEFPGCTKAFSNASDRAKHQNRTHSNAKPYLCKVAGCAKRYTDPSSLRKHVKTVHGPEFYANKKHKGLDTPGCRPLHRASANNDDEDKDTMGAGDAHSMADCLKVTSMLTPPSAEQEHSKQSHGSPHGDANIDINMSCSNGNNMAILKRNDSTRITNGPSNDLKASYSYHGDEEKNEEDEDDDISLDLPDKSPEGPLALCRAVRPSHRQSFLKGKLQAKVTSIPVLPALPSSQGVAGGLSRAAPQGLPPQQTKVYQPTVIPKSRFIKSSDGSGLPAASGTSSPAAGRSSADRRRDSSTSTLSSYMSSVRSEVSPNLLVVGGSRLSSRRSSEVSQASARMSIINSPYEYDISGNMPEYMHTAYELSSVTDHMERARLDSQTNLAVATTAQDLQSSVDRSHSSFAGDSCRRVGSVAMVAAAAAAERLTENACGSNEERSGTESPAADTPLPHERASHERRRASDTARRSDPNFVELRKLQQRYVSLNAVKPLPVPDSMKSLLTRRQQQQQQQQQSCESADTFESSRSSVANSQAAAVGGGTRSSMNGLYDEEDESSLEARLMEDGDDLIIPDDMRRFLQERARQRSTPCSGVSASPSSAASAAEQQWTQHESHRAAAVVPQAGERPQDQWPVQTYSTACSQQQAYYAQQQPPMQPRNGSQGIATVRHTGGVPAATVGAAHHYSPMLPPGPALQYHQQQPVQMHCVADTMSSAGHLCVPSLHQPCGSCQLAPACQHQGSRAGPDHDGQELIPYQPQAAANAYGCCSCQGCVACYRSSSRMASPYESTAAGVRLPSCNFAPRPPTPRRPEQGFMRRGGSTPHIQVAQVSQSTQPVAMCQRNGNFMGMTAVQSDVAATMPMPLFQMQPPQRQQQQTGMQLPGTMCSCAACHEQQQSICAAHRTQQQPSCCVTQHVPSAVPCQRSALSTACMSPAEGQQLSSPPSHCEVSSTTDSGATNAHGRQQQMFGRSVLMPPPASGEDASSSPARVEAPPGGAHGWQQQWTPVRSMFMPPPRGGAAVSYMSIGRATDNVSYARDALDPTSLASLENAQTQQPSLPHWRHCGGTMKPAAISIGASNMVVNDLSSAMTQYLEENKYLHMARP